MEFVDSVERQMRLHASTDSALHDQNIEYTVYLSKFKNKIYFTIKPHSLASIDLIHAKTRTIKSCASIPLKILLTISGRTPYRRGNPGVFLYSN
jgi:hypothetical protein